LFSFEEAKAMRSVLPISAFYRDKLTPEQVAEMRAQVEGSTLSFRQIAQALGLSATTVSRYARQEGWRRPADSAAPDRPETPNPVSSSPAPPGRSARRDAPPADRRDQIVDRLWTLAERHAEVLETQPIERAERSLQPLARLTRTLGEMDKHIRPPLAAHDDPIDTPKPRRTLNELRDELAAHLERINREEGYGWEVREWWFKDGGGI
jgi:transposase